MADLSSKLIHLPSIPEQNERVAMTIDVFLIENIPEMGNN
jgi:hypothetical protein